MAAAPGKVLPTSKVYSTAELLGNRSRFKVGETIEIRITAKDKLNVTKTYGGDYFRVKLFTATSRSSTAFDVTNDLGNGTYLASVTLRWPGVTGIYVTLVHCSEAIRVLERIRPKDRVVLAGRFTKQVNGTNIVEDRPCVPHVLTDGSACNFTDRRTGYPWFCRHPTNLSLSCDDWHFYGPNASSTLDILPMVTEEEKALVLMHKVSIKGSPITIDVQNDTEDWFDDMTRFQRTLPPCLPGQHLKNTAPSGFFHHDVWYSHQCEIQRFDKEGALSCISNKRIYIYGDSTVRQLYSYLSSQYKPTLIGTGKRPDRTARVAGPMTAIDSTHNITIHFNFHFAPARPSSFLRLDALDYVVNRIDDLEADENTVVVIGVGTHFTTFSLELYEERIRGIKDAVERLHARSPQTLVVLKSANTREHKNVLHLLCNSEWYIKTIDQKMRQVFSDYPKVSLIDAWDMTVAQNFRSIVHPKPPVVFNLLNYLMSFICPKNKK
ncbi:NXPE family member 3-like [Diadema antillarum]|uniref:NXPE family member 3-like n=1 Tax=Diadema antillarum TaxID=105358 RepID=UPI003A89918E